MEKLLKYLNSLSLEQRAQFCEACNVTEGALRTSISKGRKIDAATAINIERESRRKVMCEDVRPDVDWAAIRGTKKRKGDKNGEL